MKPISKRIYRTLEIFALHDSGFHVSFWQAHDIDQRPWRALLIRGWIAWRPGKGFHITRQGRDAWNEFHSCAVQRKNPRLPLTSFFDSKAYGLIESPGKVLEMTAGRKTSAA